MLLKIIQNMYSKDSNLIRHRKKDDFDDFCNFETSTPCIVERRKCLIIFISAHFSPSNHLIAVYKDQRPKGLSSESESV